MFVAEQNVGAAAGHWQALFAHVCAEDRHAPPHPLQLPLSLVVLISQPVDASPSQSAKPGEHETIVHPAVVHASAALRVLHALPQPKQLLASAVTLTSHPFDARPSQSAYPAAHDETAHAEPLHTSLA